MPIASNYTTPSTWAVAGYHVVQQLTLDYVSGQCTATVASFLSKEAKDAGKSPIYSQQIVLEGMPESNADPKGYAEALLAMAETLAPFDAAMADIYAARTGLKTAEIESMLDAETWIGGSDAVAKGFADGLLPSDATKKDANASGRDSIAAHRIDALLAKQGVPRSERRQLIKEIKSGTQNAVAPGTRDAADNVPAVSAGVIANLKLAIASLEGVTS